MPSFFLQDKHEEMGQWFAQRNLHLTQNCSQALAAELPLGAVADLHRSPLQGDLISLARHLGSWTSPASRQPDSQLQPAE